MDIQLKNFEDYNRPSRKPWLVLLVALVVGFVLLHRYLRSPEAPPDDGKGEGSATAQTAAADGSATTAVPKKQPAASGKLQEPKPAIPGDRDAGKRPPAELARLLDEGKAMEGQRDWLGARRQYLSLLDVAGNDGMRKEVEQRLGVVNITLVTTSLDMPEKKEHTVKAGDQIQKIARQYGSTRELIEKSNGIKDPRRMAVGSRLRVLTGAFSLAVSKGRNELTVSLDGKFFKKYPVCTGKDGCTPEGTFAIAYKESEPVWWKDNKQIPFGHPENILGTRWLGLKSTGDTPEYKSYGIHGTWEPETIGKAMSAGCVRMKNGDVEELFTILPVGVPVTIGK